METVEWNELTGGNDLGEAERNILVWHVFQGVMIVKAGEAHQNPFHVYWQEIPDAWVDVSSRRGQTFCLPTKADADAYDCVIAKDRNGDVRMAGWHQFGSGTSLTAWQPPPKPPIDYKERWKSAK